MADTKISALTNGTTANATDRLPVARSGTNVYITPAYIQTYLGLATADTWANISASSPASGTVVRVSNIGSTGAGSFWIRGTSRWYPLNSSVGVYQQDTPQTGITNAAETIVAQLLIPAGVLQVGDRVRVYATISKSGTTDTANIGFRFGTAGTLSDTLIGSGTSLSAANRSIGTIWDYKLVTATTIQRQGTPAGAGAYSVANAVAFPAAVTISSAAANALYFSVTLVSSSTNDTVGLQDARYEILSTTN